MRLRLRNLLTFALATVVATAAFGQRREGTYRPEGAPPASWKINDFHTLIWNGEPYIPFGARVDADPKAIANLAQAGIKDVVVDLPANGTGWKEAFGALEAAKLRYLIRINSLAPMAQGYEISPQSYRLSGIIKPRLVEFDLPGATSAFALLALKRDSSIAFSGVVPVKDGRFALDAKPGAALEHVLLVYPNLTSLDQPDFWEKLDTHRDTLLGTLRRNPPGPGFRGLVNPMGRLMSLPGRESRLVPTAEAFQIEFRESLEKKYSSVTTAARSWGMGANSINTFEDLARLVPLWRGSRGVGLLLDPATGRTIAADSRNNTVWRDLNEVITATETRRFNRLVSAIRSVVDVPVIQEWAGWSPPYETSAPALDGVAMRVSGTTPNELAETGSRAASSVMRWLTQGWLTATDVDFGTSPTTSEVVSGVTEDLLSMGARGLFFRTDDSKVLTAVIEEAKRREPETTLGSNAPNPIFFPENATNPAVVQRLPNNAWWLPAPSDGDRIDLGPNFFAYRMRQRSVGSALALWARVPGRYKLRMVTTKGITCLSLDGSDPGPKNVKGGLEVNLSQIPLLIMGSEEVAVPEPAYAETMQAFDSLLKDAETQHRDASEERISFRDALNGFDRNPGGNFALMRQILLRLAAKVGASTWIEVERATDNNFSEPLSIGGCSGGSALSLVTPVPSGPEGYFANVKLPIRTMQEQTVWVAARIPREFRDRVSLQIGAQKLTLKGEPIGLYGDGFGWYKAGVTRLNDVTNVLKVLVDGRQGADLAIDVLVLTPSTAWVPNGVLVRPETASGG